MKRKSDKYKSLISSLIRNSLEIPDLRYISWFGNNGEEEVISFKNAFELVCSYKDWLESLGVKRETTIAIVPNNDIDSVMVILASVCLGCRILFLPSYYPNDKLKKYRDRVSASFVFISKRYRNVQFENCIDIISFKRIKKSDNLILKYESDLQRTVFLFGTSGSTGDSKIVEQSELNAISNALAIKHNFNLSEASSIMGCLPIYHVNGFHFTVLCSLVSGISSFLIESFDPFRYSSLIDKIKPTLISLVPPALDALLRVRKKSPLPSSLEYIVTAASPLSQRIAQEIFEKWKLKVYQGYGLTETTNFSTMTPKDIADHTYEKFMLKSDIPTIGTEINGVNVQILDNEGKKVNEEYKIGEICVRGDNVMRCYFNDNDSTVEAFKYGWFHTGDKGYMVKDDRGQKYYFLKGRIKNTVKINGILVSYEEVERVIRMNDFVKDCGCISVQGEDLEESIIVSVSFRDIAPNLDDLKANLLNELPFVIPYIKFVMVDNIPRSSTGKINRAELYIKYKN